MRARLTLLLALTGALVPRSLTAQDVELLGRIHGTRPPEAYLRRRAEDPEAYRFSRGRRLRLRASGAEAASPLSVTGATVTARAAQSASVGPREGSVEGTFFIPVVLGLFADSPLDVEPFAWETVQEAYFGEGSGTIHAYYAEVSGGRAEVVGHVQSWIRSTRTQGQATGGESGLVAGTVGPFIVDLLGQITGVDWGLYDNDGPDGIPNSGDDDGYVDALAVIHPTRGAECGGSDKETRIWSHRWSLQSAAGSTFSTESPAAGGGVIRIDDYLIEPVYACSGSTLNEIGVFTHELGHVFGLPDLYDTYPEDGRHNGAGNWDLMATGSWGCDGRSPQRPCHLGAWSKAMLGWVDVVTVPAEQELTRLTLPPVESSLQVYRLEAQDASNEYFLLENRQRLGFDGDLFGEGLLVWQITQPLVEARWASNTVNAFSQMGVWLRQADGLDELGTPGGGRGDADDPFPYETVSGSHRDFHASSVPAARSRLGTATGVTLRGAVRQGDDLTFELRTRLTNVTVHSEGDTGAGGLLSVNGVSVPDVVSTTRVAPFDTYRVEAAAGESIADGVRRPFVGWDDAPEAGRARELVTPLEDLTLTARYDGEEVELDLELTGGVNGVTPATFETDPIAEGLWFEEGSSVSIRAVPRTGFRFLQWTGALEGQPNPAAVVMDGPVKAGADFEVTFRATEANVSVTATVTESITLVPENGTAPYYWRIVQGRMPIGMYLDGAGTLSGAALEVGGFPMQVEVRDAIGLTAQSALLLQVSEPVFPVRQLASPFLLTNVPMSEVQVRFLDRVGNENGIYDLGDLRAWVLAHPGLPLTAELRALVAEPRSVVIPTTPMPPGGAR
jgi:M6 family metalloprotease-like protein